MNSNLDRIASDHEVGVKRLSKKELRVGLECSRRVRTHIKKQVNKEAGSRYFYNLLVLETIIRSYEKALEELPEEKPKVTRPLKRDRVRIIV